MTDHVYKSVEITGTSTEGVTEAIDVAIAKASQSLRNLDWFEVVGIRGHIGDDGKRRPLPGHAEDRVPARRLSRQAPISGRRCGCAERTMRDWDSRPRQGER